MRIGPELRPEETEKKFKTKGEQKSQNRDISPLCGGATCEPISIKFCMFIDLTNVVTYTNIPMVHPGQQVEKRMFPYMSQFLISVHRRVNFDTKNNKKF